MHIKHAYKLKYFSPFLSIINKGVKEKQYSPLFVLNKKNQWGVKSNQNVMIPIVRKKIYQFSALWYQLKVHNVVYKTNVFNINLNTNWNWYYLKLKHTYIKIYMSIQKNINSDTNWKKSNDTNWKQNKLKCITHITFHP